VPHRNGVLGFHPVKPGTPHFRVEATSVRSFNALAAAAKTDSHIAARVAQF